MVQLCNIDFKHKAQGEITKEVSPVIFFQKNLSFFRITLKSSKLEQMITKKITSNERQYLIDKEKYSNEADKKIQNLQNEIYDLKSKENNQLK